MPEIRILFQQPVRAIVNAQAGANKAVAGHNPARHVVFSRD
jgi:hypothetical protein